MKHGLFILMLVALAAGSAVSAANETLAFELQKLDVSAGHWVYHGETLGTPVSKPGKWTWNEDCGWSANQAFMVCSFTNNWAGKIVKSLVVDTWNKKDKSYWHYELFPDGAGGKPFISRMTVTGNTRVEYATDNEHGRKVETRITYVFDSATHVKVKIETSNNGVDWVTVDQGEGVKRP
ncbi:MAG TPA: hypothetical protein VJS89_10510 [Gammaproteobacteria bacterium]|nr:hypothetical protein [Gammaproteobacteria bacterium]